MDKHDYRYKAIYQDYNWCYEKFITEGLSHSEMAKEIGATTRVVQKWCSEKHKLNEFTRQNYLTINDIQHDLIIGSILGDGHITKRENSPMFMVSHAENQKEYLYWKYFLLENLCKNEPVKLNEKEISIRGKLYNRQNQYRFYTRCITELSKFKKLSLEDVINKLNEFSLSVFILDDATRGDSNWLLCVAALTEHDKELLINICFKYFSLNCHLQKDIRYLLFDSESSKKIDNMILRNIPNELDIIKEKITENKNIKELANYVYVNVQGKLIGISTYMRYITYPLDLYYNLREKCIQNNIKVINEEDVLKYLQEDCRY